MKRPKDRLYKALVIGANPAGIAATNKLGELGIPVTLIDSDPDLDQKLAAEEYRLPSGVTFNFAHRPGLLRTLRNPLIRSLCSSEVMSLKHTPQGFRAKISRRPTFVDPDQCTLCGQCAKVCPVITPEGRRPIQLNSRRAIPGRPVIDKRKIPLCQEGCPLGVNAQAYVALASQGRFQEALEVVRRDNALPGVCGRICTHPCEKACRRGELDESIAIREIKRFLADYELKNPEDRPIPRPAQKKERVAIVGSGPAGLSAAADLARYGYRVTVFEKEPKAGGLLRYGVGEHRLPREILDQDIAWIERAGVEILTSRPMALPDELPTLTKDFDAVLLAVGAWKDRRLGVPGEDLRDVEGCISFLTRFYREGPEEIQRTFSRSPHRAAVIGDGNAAFDLARTLKRLGADVTLLSWFPEALIPADPDEIRGAKEEEIVIKDRTQVIAFIGDDRKLHSLRCRPTEPGKPDAQGIPWPIMIPESTPFDLAFDLAFVAIGQRLTMDPVKGLDKVFSAGDGLTGPSSVVQAMADGRAAARSIHGLLGCKEHPAGTYRPKDLDFEPIPAHFPPLSRPTVPERQGGVRMSNFSEVSLGLSEGQVRFEAERCLQCGICSECLLCTEVCGGLRAISHGQKPEEIMEQVGVVIVADPAAAPDVKGEDVVRAYGPSAARADTHAMITRGFAAAAKAMTLLSKTSQRPRGRGVSTSPPDPGLSPEIRMGVFVCRCNDSFGWHKDLDLRVEGLTRMKDVVHAEIMTSACVPQGSSKIIRSVREKGITRIVLASCVCCPLDFVCSACTDQRSRLKDALFKGTGISRSMVETCNLRGEALRHLVHEPLTALRRFSGLIERSMHRARRLRPLSAPARTYNFTTALIGQSEAALSAAMTLAEAGLEVLMFGTGERPLTQTIEHPNILCFEDSSVTGLSGTLGDFQVYVESRGFSQVLPVGAVILGEKSRKLIPYISQEGLPPRIVTSSMQRQGVPGIPYLYPGCTSIAGLFLASPAGIPVSEIKKGAAAAILAAAVMPRGPRQSKGYTVAVDETTCRGCGRCLQTCPYQAITLKRNGVGGWHAFVDEALCKGCGNCISICPSNAADSPYRNRAYLEQLLEEILVGRQLADA